MPRDVSTRWNSTFDMVQFAVAYHEPLNDLTGSRAMKLRNYELTEEEWQIAEQLSGVLNVSIYFTIIAYYLHLSLDFQASNSLFLGTNAKPFESNSRNGLHRQAPRHGLY